MKFPFGALPAANGTLFHHPWDRAAHWHNFKPNHCIQPQWVNSSARGGCIYASLNWVIFGSGNGLSPVQRQAISWTNTGLLSIELAGASFSGIWIWILSFLFKKMQLKRLSAKMAAILSRGRWFKKKRWPNFLPQICVARLEWVKILKNVFMLTYTVVFFFVSEIQRNRDFYKTTDVRPPFTYASLIRQVSDLDL